jgi:hypothetical protein
LREAHSSKTYASAAANGYYHRHVDVDWLMLIGIARTRMQVGRSSAAPATPPDHRLASA